MAATAQTQAEATKEAQRAGVAHADRERLGGTGLPRPVRLNFPVVFERDTEPASSVCTVGRSYAATRQASWPCLGLGR